jgi:hypothetical protein
MDLFVRKNKLLVGIPALFIITAGILENGRNQYNSKKPENNQIPNIDCLAKSLLAIGLIGVAYAISMDRNFDIDFADYKTQVVFSAVISIGITHLLYDYAANMEKQNKDTEECKDKRSQNSFYYSILILFIISWSAIGYASTYNKSKFAVGIGIAASVSIIISFIISDFQRRNSIVDGPMMALMSIGYLLLTFSTALEN